MELAYLWTKGCCSSKVPPSQCHSLIYLCKCDSIMRGLLVFFLPSPFIYLGFSLWSLLWVHCLNHPVHPCRAHLTHQPSILFINIRESGRDCFRLKKLIQSSMLILMNDCLVQGLTWTLHLRGFLSMSLYSEARTSKNNSRFTQP